MKFYLGLISFLIAFSTQTSATNLPKALNDADFLPRNENLEQLGKLLFFDKILSGNKNIACSTCHHPLTGSGDGLSLSVGEGGLGLGIARNVGKGKNLIHARVPRNAMPLFNIGAKENTTMFHDGRVEIDETQISGFRSPAGNYLPLNIFDNPLQVQAMFPVTSAEELAGNAGENAIADAGAKKDFVQVWTLLAKRLQAIPEYVTLFKRAFPTQIYQAKDISYAHAAVAIGAFESAAFRCDNSRFDKYLRGDKQALTASEIKGMNLFYGEAGCGACHKGVLQTDHDFHATAMPQIGSGKGDNQTGFNDGADDFGRERVTKNIIDRFRFRTLSLRMVAMTAPWGHAGAFNELRTMIKHGLNPVKELEHYDTKQAVLPFEAKLSAKDFVVQNNPLRRSAIAEVSEITPSKISEKEIDDIVDFLHALTDMSCVDLRRIAPEKVPSKLSLAD